MRGLCCGECSEIGSQLQKTSTKWNVNWKIWELKIETSKVQKNSNSDSFYFSLLSVSSYFLLNSFHGTGAKIVQTICWYVRFITLPQVLFFQFILLLLFYVSQQTNPIGAQPPSYHRSLMAKKHGRQSPKLISLVDGNSSGFCLAFDVHISSIVIPMFILLFEWKGLKASFGFRILRSSVNNNNNLTTNSLFVKLTENQTKHTQKRS